MADTYLIKAFESLGEVIDYKDREIKLLKYEVERLKKELERRKLYEKENDIKK